MKTLPYLATAIVAGVLAFPATAGSNRADDPSRATLRAEDDATAAICDRVRDLRPPSADYPDPATVAMLANCESADLYYGIGMTADPVRARQCALLEVEKPDGADRPFAGAGMLMTIYANGVGAQRDLDLATAMACRIGGAEAEVGGRVRHLQERKAAKVHVRDFSFCDDITSGRAGGVCASLEADLADARRSESLAQLTASWTRAERAAFIRLQTAERTYARESGYNEVDLSGTARAAFVIEQQQIVHDAFTDLLGTLEAARLPAATPEQFQAADDRLNVVYRQLMSPEADPAEREPSGSADRLPDTTVTRTGIRMTQRAWLAYRDAWLAFAAMRYPDVSADSVATWLTRQRTDELASHLPEPTPAAVAAPAPYEVLPTHAWTALTDASGVVTGGSPEAVVAIQVIIDVNCAYCGKLFREFRERHPRLPVRWVPVAFVQPDSEADAAAILAADDPATALHDFFAVADAGGTGARPGPVAAAAAATLPAAQSVLEQHMNAWGGYVPMAIVRTVDGEVLMQGGSRLNDLEQLLQRAEPSPLSVPVW